MSTNVPLTIPSDYEAANKNLRAYRLNKEAAVTVIVYDAKRKVTANFAFPDTAALTKKKVTEIVKALGVTDGR